MSDDVCDLIKALTETLHRKKLTLSLAESCTGGKMASMITDIPGASEFFSGGAVVYSNAAKENILKVPHRTLTETGAVSAETAEEMAKNARIIFRTDIAAAVTGIAGPGGGSDQKPIGTVFIAVTDGNRTECRELMIKGSRDEVRDGTVKAAAGMLIDLIGE